MKNGWSPEADLRWTRDSLGMICKTRTAKTDKLLKRVLDNPDCPVNFRETMSKNVKIIVPEKDKRGASLTQEMSNLSLSQDNSPNIEIVRAPSAVCNDYSFDGKEDVDSKLSELSPKELPKNRKPPLSERRSLIQQFRRNSTEVSPVSPENLNKVEIAPQNPKRKLYGM